MAIITKDSLKTESTMVTVLNSNKMALMKANSKMEKCMEKEQWEWTMVTFMKAISEMKEWKEKENIHGQMAELM